MARPIPGTSMGRGSRMTRSGRQRPRRYGLKYPPQMIHSGLNATGWSNGANCTLSNPSEVGGDGISGTYLKALGTGVNTLIAADYTFPSALSFAQYDAIAFELYVDPGATFSAFGNTGASFYLYAYDVSNNYVYWDVQLAQGWQTVILHKNNIAGTSAATWAATSFTRFRIRQNAVAGYTANIRVRNLRFLRKAPQGIIIPNFDDIGISVYSTAFPIMRARGIVGDIGVITNAIGQAAWSGYDRMSQAQINEMKAAGFGAYPHSITHGASPFLTVANQAACDAEMDVSINRDGYWSPYGEVQPAYGAAALAKGFKWFRGTGLLGAQAKLAGACGDYIALGGYVYQVMCVNVARLTTTSFVLGQMQAAADSGAICGLLYHHVVTTPAAVDIERSTANFTTDMDNMLALMKAGAANMNFQAAMLECAS